MLKGFNILGGSKILGGSQSNFGMLRTFWEAPNFFSSFIWLEQNGICFSKSFCQDEKFETLEGKIGAIYQLSQKTLSNSIYTISLSHTLRCLAHHGVCFSESFCQDEKFETLEDKIGAIDQLRQKSLSYLSHTLSLSHTLRCLTHNGICFSESFSWDEKFETLRSKIRSIDQVRQKSLSNSSHTISLSHTLTCLAQNGIWFSECFHRDEKF